MDGEQTGRVLQQLETLERELNDLKQEVKTEYVTQKEFSPVAKIVYATVGLILLGFLGVLTALVYGGKHT